jgi:hypothetical protein
MSDRSSDCRPMADRGNRSRRRSTARAPVRAGPRPRRCAPRRGAARGSRGAGRPAADPTRRNASTKARAEPSRIGTSGPSRVIQRVVDAAARQGGHQMFDGRHGHAVGVADPGAEAGSISASTPTRIRRSGRGQGQVQALEDDAGIRGGRTDAERRGRPGMEGDARKAYRCLYRCLHGDPVLFCCPMPGRGGDGSRLGGTGLSHARRPCKHVKMPVQFTLCVRLKYVADGPQAVEKKKPARAGFGSSLRRVAAQFACRRRKAGISMRSCSARCSGSSS